VVLGPEVQLAEEAADGPVVSPVPPVASVLVACAGADGAATDGAELATPESGLSFGFCVSPVSEFIGF
jgi:hypothetical protein